MNRIKHLLYQRIFKIIDFYFYNRQIELLKQFKHIGNNCQLSANAFYGQPEEIEIGNNVVINDYCHFWGLGGIYIGDNTMIASHCAITTVTHDITNPTNKNKDLIQPITIGKNVWIGTQVILLPGITIGDNVIVGANSLVKHSLEANGIYAGTPAKRIK